MGPGGGTTWVILANDLIQSCEIPLYPGNNSHKLMTPISYDEPYY
jgi:hypothetical protein